MQNPDWFLEEAMKINKLSLELLSWTTLSATRLRVMIRSMGLMLYILAINQRSRSKMRNSVQCLGQEPDHLCSPWILSCGRASSTRIS